MHKLSPYPWQDTLWQNMLSIWRQKRLSHAYLLTGPQGLGKTHFAQAFALRLLCKKAQDTDLLASNVSHFVRNALPDGDSQERDSLLRSSLACGLCTSCQWLLGRAHPDVHWIEPEEPGKAIKVEQIRELVDTLQQTAQQSTYQIVLLAPAEQMNTAAANALLKTLEEPSGSVLFLLVSHQPGALPATIRSRCQSIRFPVPPLATSLDWLQKETTVTHLAFWLELADHIPLRALELVGSTTEHSGDAAIQKLIALSLDEISPLEMAALYAEMPQTIAFQNLFTFLRDLMRLQQYGEADIVYTAHRSHLQMLASRISTVKLFECFDALMHLKSVWTQKVHLNMLSAWEGWFCQQVLSFT